MFISGFLLVKRKLTTPRWMVSMWGKEGERCPAAFAEGNWAAAGGLESSSAVASTF